MTSSFIMLPILVGTQYQKQLLNKNLIVKVAPNVDDTTQIYTLGSSYSLKCRYSLSEVEEKLQYDLIIDEPEINPKEIEI